MPVLGRSPHHPGLGGAKGGAGGGKGIQVGAVQSHCTLELELERSPPKPAERVFSGVRGARTKETSTRYLRGRNPIGKQSVWPSKQVPWAPSGPRRKAMGRWKTRNLKAEGGKRKKGEKESVKEKKKQTNRKCGKSERII